MGFGGDGGERGVEDCPGGASGHAAAGVHGDKGVDGGGDAKRMTRRGRTGRPWQWPEGGDGGWIKCTVNSHDEEGGITVNCGTDTAGNNVIRPVTADEMNTRFWRPADAGYGGGH